MFPEGLDGAYVLLVGRQVRDPPGDVSAPRSSVEKEAGARTTAVEAAHRPRRMPTRPASVA